MGRRKSGNKSQAPSCSSHRNESSKSINELDTRMSAVGDEEEVVMVERTESSNVEELETLALVGSDQTSADYYFDSYSHFGNVLCYLTVLCFCFFLIRILFVVAFIG